MSPTTNDRPTCPVCKHQMALARVSAGKRGFEERMFECATCGRTVKVSVAVDPTETDRVGWLARSLEPPS
ncbi:response regulator [Bradyrhizobium brasilense]|nr:response regulator [Bradyrhizobium brasilense]OMI11923.1 response regulator [Bradyrhizobium brasilense]